MSLSLSCARFLSTSVFHGDAILQLKTESAAKLLRSEDQEPATAARSFSKRMQMGSGEERHPVFCAELPNEETHTTLDESVGTKGCCRCKICIRIHTE